MVQQKKSREFEERKLLIQLQKELDEKKHKMWMEGLEYQRESERISHEHQIEQQRIKSAEIRKMQERKELMNYRSQNG